MRQRRAGRPGHVSAASGFPIRVCEIDPGISDDLVAMQAEGLRSTC
ncbi:MAG: hypothetical protein OXI95_11175 [bacterium]|nr:hypothetical protein [bacterium]